MHLPFCLFLNTVFEEYIHKRKKKLVIVLLLIIVLDGAHILCMCVELKKKKRGSVKSVKYFDLLFSLIHYYYYFIYNLVLLSFLNKLISNVF